MEKTSIRVTERGDGKFIIEGRVPYLFGLLHEWSPRVNGFGRVCEYNTAEEAQGHAKRLRDYTEKERLKNKRGKIISYH